MKKRKITKKTIIIIAIIIAIIGIVVFKNLNKEEQVVEKPEIAEIEKRTIAKSISATGVINTTNSKTVVAPLTGMEISNVNVKKGDKINPGDVICTFDTSSVQENLNIAKASQNTAQSQANLGLESARRSLNDAITNKNTQVGASQDDVNSAKKAYDDAESQKNAVNATINDLQSKLNAIQPEYNKANESYLIAQNNYNLKESAYNQAKNNYEAKKAELDAVKGMSDLNQTNPNLQDVGAMEQGVLESENNMNLANSEYLNAKNQFESVSASFSPLQSQYNSLVSQIAELQATKANLEATASSLKNAYDKTVTAYNSVVSSADSTIASMQDNVKNSELASQSASLTTQGQINAYQEQIENGVVKSTVSGTVTEVNVKKGDLYTGTAIATIEGTEEFIIEAEIDEYDIPDVEVGMKVLIKTDATREEELVGRVTYVASSATNAASSMGMGVSTGITGANATYKIEISIESQNDRLRLGMNAKLSIITQMEDDVWSVPYDAIYERDDGTHYIEITKDSEGLEKEELDVELGIEGTYYTQVKSEKLKSGMKVVLPKVDSGSTIENLIEMMGPEAGI